MKLTDSISTIPFIGNKYAFLLNSLEIYTIDDLLHYYPKRYTDSSIIYKTSELNYDEKRAVIGKLLNINSIKTRSRITIQKASFETSDGVLQVTWFNQPFLKTSLSEGSSYLIFGKLNRKSDYPELLSPEVELLSSDTKHIGRISPVYQLTAGLKNKWLRTRLKWILDKFDYLSDFQDPLSEKIKNKYSITDLRSALLQIHFPDDQKKLDLAKYRLGFDEMLKIQIKIEKQKQTRSKLVSKNIKIDQSLLDKTIAGLEFKLTPDQNKVLKEILGDLQQDKPMQRLLQGDVGTGKTIIAILTSLVVQKNGYKIAYLAPTTILSEQIFESFKKTLGNKNIFLVNSKSKIRANEITDNSIIIGTHALLFKETDFFKNLNFLIIDEEHRFGVKQRLALTKLDKQFTIHKLSMTATPIPRSLAMSIWGDTDISYIKSKPIGRIETETLFVPKSKIENSYKWIQKQIDTTKTQIFWVCPLIEDSEKVNAKSTQEIFQVVKNKFPKQKTRLVHGKTKDKEKQIEEFKKLKFDILVTTPIIEVGIDIPTANLMVIESSERFGLAQLHQFRGRVGRGGEKSYCLLFSTETDLTFDQKTRLKYFCNNSDGLKLAEFDLKRRGPGEVYGLKQSGIPDLKIANIFDEKLLRETKEAAKMIIKK